MREVENRPVWWEKPFFTTGEAAEVCRLSQQTIIRCFDSGRLKGYRVPGSRFRRIPREDLLAFMQASEISIEALVPPPRRVVLVEPDGPSATALRRALGRVLDDLEVLDADEAFAAGLRIGQLRPAAVVLDVETPGVDVEHVCALLEEAFEPSERPRVIAVGPPGWKPPRNIAFLARPLHLEALVEELREMLR